MATAITTISDNRGESLYKNDQNFLEVLRISKRLTWETYNMYNIKVLKFQIFRYLNMKLKLNLFALTQILWQSIKWLFGHQRRNASTWNLKTQY